MQNLVRFPRDNNLQAVMTHWLWQDLFSEICKTFFEIKNVAQIIFHIKLLEKKTRIVVIVFEGL